MYDSGPSDAELEAIGIRREDVTDHSDFEVWPDNWLPFMIFTDVQTQWRTGGGGATGLDYNVVKWIIELREVEPSEHLDVLMDIGVLERSALSAMNK